MPAIEGDHDYALLLEESIAAWGKSCTEVDRVLLECASKTGGDIECWPNAMPIKILRWVDAFPLFPVYRCIDVALMDGVEYDMLLLVAKTAFDFGDVGTTVFIPSAGFIRQPFTLDYVRKGINKIFNHQNEIALSFLCAGY